jgi:hypothetical protein
VLLATVLAVALAAAARVILRPVTPSTRVALVGTVACGSLLAAGLGLAVVGAEPAGAAASPEQAAASPTAAADYQQHGTKAASALVDAIPGLVKEVTSGGAGSAAALDRLERLTKAAHEITGSIDDVTASARNLVDIFRGKGKGGGSGGAGGSGTVNVDVTNRNEPSQSARATVEAPRQGTGGCCCVSPSCGWRQSDD